MPESLRLLAPAKINLFLRVIGRRPDGYHTLSMLMQKLALFDELVLERAADGLELRCPQGGAPEGPENLAFRAASLFFARTGLDFGLRITLEKRIPAAAGLGGGSSDAAAVLRGLNSMSGAPLDADALAALALELGADVPFFVHPAPAALAEGVGEILTPAEPLRDRTVLLVNPGFAVSTAWAYRNLDLTGAGPNDTFAGSPAGGGLGVNHSLVNDLEGVVTTRHPVIAEIKAALLQEGASATLMSGSGPTVFGLFPDPARAAEAARVLQTRFARVFLVEPLVTPVQDESCPS